MRKCVVRVISQRPLKAFWKKHPDAETGLRHWIQAAEHASWKNFADVRHMFASAGQVGRFTVFNVGGNKYRLVVVIHYNTGKIYVRHILTHPEYDLGKWKKD